MASVFNVSTPVCLILIKANSLFFAKSLILSAIHFSEFADLDKTADALSVAEIMISIAFFTTILLAFFAKRIIIYYAFISYPYYPWNIDLVKQLIGVFLLMIRKPIKILNCL